MDAIALSKKVRINPQELNTLIEVAGAVFTQIGMIKLGVFGGRLDLKAKTPEIELLVLYKNEVVWNNSFSAAFRSQMQEEFPKIDISVVGYCIKSSINSDEAKKLFNEVKAKVVWLWEI